MKQDLKQDKVHFGRTGITYHYGFAKRKHLAISVYPDLSVVAVAPETATLDKIREKIIKRGGWILKQKRFFAQFLPVTQPRRYVSGECHLYLGKRYRLRVSSGNENRVKLTGGFFQVTVKGQKSSAKAKDLMTQWYRHRSETIFSQQLDVCLEFFSRYAIEKPDYQIRTLRSRWGNCSQSGVLSLNKDLIKTPKKCIQYVITHEVCHLIEPNHSPRFYALLDTVLPEWRSVKEQLNLFGSVVA